MQISTKLRFMLPLFFLLCSGLVWAQDRTITGKVTAEEEGELPGVNVLVKGTTTGTVTDLEGNYRLNVPEGSETLVFSSIGYASQEVAIGSQSEINVTLAPDVKSLSEVVVVGYGQQEKKDVTGALSTIKSEDFNPGVINSPEQLFQGKLSGVQVTQNGGAPGGPISVNIRGTNSVRSGNQPLFVVDGIPLTNDNPNAQGQAVSGGTGGAPQNPLNFLNPDDIASIDVLKDASAAAIYGSRAANGVVLITTKKGKSGEGTVTYSTYGSVSYLRKEYDLLTADEFRSTVDEFDLTATDFGGNTDWQDEVFRTAFTNNHSLAFSGGNESGNYRVSLSALDQEGIIDRNELQRYTARINATQKSLGDKLTLGLQLTATRTEDQFAPGLEEGANARGDLIINTMRANPTAPIFNNDGTYFQDIDNPVAILNLVDDNAFTNRILGSISAEYEIIDGLSYKINFGGDIASSERRTDISQLLNVEANRGTGTINSRATTSVLIDHLVNYNKQLGESNLKALAGYSYQSFRVQGSTVSRADPLIDNVKITPNLLFGGASNFAPTSFVDNREIQSFFGRVTYSYQDKYIATGTFRIDEASTFGEDNTVGYFPSFALGWRLSEETFMANSPFDNLKLRAGWGVIGNQEGIPTTQQVFVFGSDNTTRLPQGGNILPGLALLRAPNPALSWEQQQQLNIGVDFDILGGRFGGTLDFFDKTTTDLVLFRNTIQPAPGANTFANLEEGELKNTGFEFNLYATAVDNGDFRWDIEANATFLQTEIRNLNLTRIAGAEAKGQGLTNVTVQYFTNGQPANVFLGRRFLGINEDGENIFVQNEEGQDDQFQVLGDPNPDAIFGLTNTFRYKNFDFNFLLSGQAGNQVYNNAANAIFTFPALGAGGNVPQSVVEEARETGESVSNANSYSSRFIEDGDFIRLTNATLGYNVNTQNIDWLSRMRIYVSTQNLFVITGYSGLDPEVNSQPGTGDNTTPQASGIDNIGYPRATVFQAGLNLAF